MKNPDSKYECPQCHNSMTIVILPADPANDALVCDSPEEGPNRCGYWITINKEEE